jgi:hypothetical protein
MGEGFGAPFPALPRCLLGAAGTAFPDGNTNGTDADNSAESRRNSPLRDSVSVATPTGIEGHGRRGTRCRHRDTVAPGWHIAHRSKLVFRAIYGGCALDRRLLRGRAMTLVALRVTSLLIGMAALGVACGGPSPATPEADAPSALTVDGCGASGGNIVGAGATLGPGDPGPNYPIEVGCPGGRTLLGDIDANTDGGLAICCLLPPSLSSAECRSAGGYEVLDPGSGSRYVEGCPGAGKLLGWLRCDQPDSGLCGEGGICCAPR